MKYKQFSIVFALLSSVQLVLAQGTAFTYQGLLNDGALPATGIYDLQFSLWNAPAGPSQVDGTINVNDLPITNGLFTVTLDFGAGAFEGSARWLEVDVRPGASGGAYTALPRTQLLPSPYAIYAGMAATATTATTATTANGVAANAVTSAGIADGAVATVDLAANAVTSAKIADNSVTSTKIVDGAVTSTDIADGTIATVDLANNAVNSDKITDGAVTSAKLASDPASLNKVTAGQMIDLGTRIAVASTGNPIDTNLFSGLGFQYYEPTGEGAIMSAYDDGYGFLSFYTKEGFGFPIKQRMVIARDGNVGIGTNGPRTVLDVKGTDYITAHTDGIVNIGDTAGYHATLDNNELHAKYGTNTSDLFLNDFGDDVYIARSGNTFISDVLNVYNGVNVGIGTTSPDAVLDVYGTRSIGTSSDGIVNIGNSAAYHLTLDNNEIHAKNGTNNSTLYLNDFGGGVWIGSSLFVNYGVGATIYGAATVSGDLRTTGVTRDGSETGTSQAPSPAGLVTRRINTTSTTAGQIVARTDNLTLERDGSNGGFLIRYPASPGNITVAAMGINSAGAQVNRYFNLASPATAGSAVLYSDAQSVVHFECTFGRTYLSGQDLTQVTLSRYAGDWYWSGNVVSTYNQ